MVPNHWQESSPRSNNRSTIPDDWRLSKLSEISDIRLSNVDKKSVPGEVPVRLCNYLDVYENISITNGLDFMEATASYAEVERFIVEPGDVIVTKDSETPDDIGVPAVSLATIPDLVCGYHLALIKPNRSEVEPVFLASQIAHNRIRHYFSLRASGSTRFGLTTSVIENTLLWLPPLPEQRRIAEILDTADEAIRQTERVIAKLREVKQGLLHDLLTRGLDAGGHLRDPIAHPEQFKDSPLGRIPREWEVTRLEDVSRKITSGSRGWASYYSSQGSLFLRIGNLTREHINLDLRDVVHVNPPIGSEGTRTEVQDGDILISITADLGIIGVIPNGFSKAYVNQHISLVSISSSELNRRWIGHYLAGAEAGQSQFLRLDDTGAKSGMNLSAIGALQIPLPPQEEQNRIVSIFDAHDVRIRAEEEVLAKRRQLKRGLMDDLLTGRVRV